MYLTGCRLLLFAVIIVSSESENEDDNGGVQCNQPVAAVEGKLRF